MLSITQPFVSDAAARKTVQILIVSFWAAALAGCTTATSPARLAGDVDVFAAGVVQATTAYREQRDFFVAYRNEQEWAKLRRAVQERAEGKPAPRLLIGRTLGSACKNAVNKLSEKAARTKDISIINGSTAQPVLAGISDADFHRGRDEIKDNCRLQLKVGQDIALLNLNRPNPNPLHDRLAEGLEGYVQGLSLLVSNADRAEFDQAAAAASKQFREFFASTQDIALKLSDSDTKPLEIDKELGIIGDALAKAIEASLEAKRRQEIARIVEASQDVIARAAQKLAAVSRHYHISAAQDLAENYRKAVQEANLSIRENNSDFNEKINEAASAEQDMAVYMALDPATSFSAMVDAHSSLARKIQNPEIDLGVLAGDIQDFYQTSTATLEAFQSLRRKISTRPEEENQI